MNKENEKRVQKTGLKLLLFFFKLIFAEEKWTFLGVKFWASGLF